MTVLRTATGSMSAVVSKRARKLKRGLYATVERLMRPDTGEEVRALVASMPVDKRAFREFGLHVGDEVRVELKKARNPYFWRKAHILGGWLADNVPGFEGMTQHAAIKELQEQSGIGCIAETFDIPNVGKLVRNVADSLNFAEMDETAFGLLWDGGEAASYEGGWLGWLRANKWRWLAPEQIAEVEALIEKPR